MSAIYGDDFNLTPDEQQHGTWKHRLLLWLLETIGVLAFLRDAVLVEIDERLPTTLQEVIDQSDLSNRLSSFQMQLENEMKQTDEAKEAIASVDALLRRSFKSIRVEMSNLQFLVLEMRTKEVIPRDDEKAGDLNPVRCSCGAALRLQRVPYTRSDAEYVDAQTGIKHECGGPSNAVPKD